MFLKGILGKEIIKRSEQSFSLNGMINPTFQNVGTSPVMVDGRILESGDTFYMDCPNVILTNAISIQFTGTSVQSKLLYCHFVRLEENDKC